MSWLAAATGFGALLNYKGTKDANAANSITGRIAEGKALGISPQTILGIQHTPAQPLLLGDAFQATASVFEADRERKLQERLEATRQKGLNDRLAKRIQELEKPRTAPNGARYQAVPALPQHAKPSQRVTKDQTHDNTRSDNNGAGDLRRDPRRLSGFELSNGVYRAPDPYNGTGEGFFVDATLPMAEDYEMFFGEIGGEVYGVAHYGDTQANQKDLARRFYGEPKRPRQRPPNLFEDQQGPRKGSVHTWIEEKLPFPRQKPRSAPQRPRKPSLPYRTEDFYHRNNNKY